MAKIRKNNTWAEKVDLKPSPDDKGVYLGKHPEEHAAALGEVASLAQRGPIGGTIIA